MEAGPQVQSHPQLHSKSKVCLVSRKACLKNKGEQNKMKLEISYRAWEGTEPWRPQHPGLAVPSGGMQQTEVVCRQTGRGSLGQRPRKSSVRRQKPLSGVTLITQSLGALGGHEACFQRHGVTGILPTELSGQSPESLLSRVADNALHGVQKLFPWSGLRADLNNLGSGLETPEVSPMPFPDLHTSSSSRMFPGPWRIWWVCPICD